MEDDGVSYDRRYIMYWAVKFFGERSYDTAPQRQKERKARLKIIQYQLDKVTKTLDSS